METGVNPAVTSTGQNMHQDSWQTSAWVSQAATSNCNLMDSQQYSLASGFATQSEAEIALSANGKCKFKAIQGLLYTWTEDLSRFFQILCQLI